MIKFRKLNADEIDVKVGSVTNGGYTLLLYKNARVDMNILDETVGVDNWQNKFYEVVGNLYCSVGININHDKPDKEPYWIWKDDCGIESQFGDKEKGQASDARKRSGVVWGIGRELYTAPFMFIECETKYDEGKKVFKVVDLDERKRSQHMSVKEISYNDKGEINKLVIVDNKGNVVYPKEKFGKAHLEEIKEDDRLLGGDYRFSGGKHDGKTIREVAENDNQYLDYLLASDKVGAFIKENIIKFRGE